MILESLLVHFHACLENALDSLSVYSWFIILARTEDVMSEFCHWLN